MKCTARSIACPGGDPSPRPVQSIPLSWLGVPPPHPFSTGLTGSTPTPWLQAWLEGTPPHRKRPETRGNPPLLARRHKPVKHYLLFVLRARVVNVTKVCDYLVFLLYRQSSENFSFSLKSLSQGYLWQVFLFETNPIQQLDKGIRHRLWK